MVYRSENVEGSALFCFQIDFLIMWTSLAFENSSCELFSWAFTHTMQPYEPNSRFFKSEKSREIHDNLMSHQRSSLEVASNIHNKTGYIGSLINSWRLKDNPGWQAGGLLWINYLQCLSYWVLHWAWQLTWQRSLQHMKASYPGGPRHLNQKTQHVSWRTDWLTDRRLTYHADLHLVFREAARLV